MPDQVKSPWRRPALLRWAAQKWETLFLVAAVFSVGSSEGVEGGVVSRGGVNDPWLTGKIHSAKRLRGDTPNKDVSIPQAPRVSSSNSLQRNGFAPYVV
jgi:hypothetical protein